MFKFFVAFSAARQFILVASRFQSFRDFGVAIQEVRKPELLDSGQQLGG
jgi:hypothetical protein